MRSLSNAVVIVVIYSTVLVLTSTAEEAVSASTPASVIYNVTTKNNSQVSEMPPNTQANLIEGGGKVSVKSNAPVNTSQHSREHINETITGSNSTVTSATTAFSNNTQNVTLVNVTESSILEKPGKPNKLGSVFLPNATNYPEHKKISARKGANFVEEMKVPFKKPTITVASEGEPYPASHFQTKLNSSSHNILKVPNLDMLNASSESKTQKYIVPIVIVILSVPFVAILISILYKQGSEWWKYRHYRRMDFLINGMYDH